MSDLQVFNNPKFGAIRTAEINGDTHFVAKDITTALGYKDHIKATQQHCRWVVKHHIPHPQSPDKTIEVNVIPKGDIYRLAANSELPGAEEFESWIFDEVLTTIDKHGAYMSAEKIEEVLINPDALIKLATIIKEEQQKRAEERQKRLEAEKKLDEQKPMIMFAESCIASNDCLLVREVAKLATKNGIVIGEKRLWQKLRDWGEISSKQNEPYQHAMDAGRWELKQGTYNTPYGSDTYRTFKVTPKGQIYIVERLKREAVSA